MATRPEFAFSVSSTNDVLWTTAAAAGIFNNYLKYLDKHYSDAVIFVHDDLSVELLRELPPELNDGQNDTYDPERLDRHIGADTTTRAYHAGVRAPQLTCASKGLFSL